MNNVSSLLKPAMMALSLAVVPVFATAAEERRLSLEVGKPRESTEVTTTMVLHQRLDEPLWIRKEACGKFRSVWSWWIPGPLISGTRCRMHW